MAADLHLTVASRLEAGDQRYTARRQALVGVLAAAGRPLTISEIVAAEPSLPQSSVYRNLGVLEQTGSVRRVHAADEFVRYELAEDLTGHHHHLVCTECGAVEDLTMAPQLERSVEQAVDEVAAGTGFRVQHHRLDLIGVCARCVPQ